MNVSTMSGLVQIITGALALFYQGWTLFHGVSLDPGHAVVGAGLVGGGIAHLTNGRH